MAKKATKKAAKAVEVKEEVVVEEEVKSNVVELGAEENPAEMNIEADATTEPWEIEEPIPEEKLDKEIKKAEEMMVIGKVRKPIYQKSSFIKTKVLKTPLCLYELPEDIRRYLTNKGWGTNVYLKGEEWLVKHNADMNMIEKLKKFISEHYM